MIVGRELRLELYRWVDIEDVMFVSVLGILVAFSLADSVDRRVLAPILGKGCKVNRIHVAAVSIFVQIMSSKEV